ncbi:MAG: hypothetical protein ACRCWJ_14915 [Casimicrobium sp.]
MSRSGYTEDNDDPLATGRWRANVERSLRGKRGQKLLRDLLQALDEMPDKRLYPGSFATADGELCALGALGAKRGVKMDDLCDEGFCDTELVGARFLISPTMAAEIMYVNDEYEDDCYKWVDVQLCGPVRPYYPDYGRHTWSTCVYNENHAQERWGRMREWVKSNLLPEPPK